MSVEVFTLLSIVIFVCLCLFSLYILKKFGFKTFDLVVQTILFAIFILPLAFLWNEGGQNFFTYFGVLLLLLPYQVISAVYVVANGLNKHALRLVGQARLGGLIILVCLLFYSPYSVFFLIFLFFPLTVIDSLGDILKRGRPDL
jgi:hypothetical protein